MRLLLILFFIGEGIVDPATASSGVADGCARLADVVFHAVLHEALPGQLPLVTAEREQKTCEDTAATVSRAFTSAMSRLGVSMAWGRQAHAFCATSDVTSCFPVPHPNMGYGLAGGDTLVAGSWRAVQVAVVARLLYDAGVDRSRFTVAGLQRSLAIAFASSPGRSVLFAPETRPPDREADIAKRERQQYPPGEPSVVDR